MHQFLVLPHAMKVDRALSVAAGVPIQRGVERHAFGTWWKACPAPRRLQIGQGQATDHLVTKLQESGHLVRAGRAGAELNRLGKSGNAVEAPPGLLATMPGADLGQIGPAELFLGVLFRGKGAVASPLQPPGTKRRSNRYDEQENEDGEYQP